MAMSSEVRTHDSRWRMALKSIPSPVAVVRITWFPADRGGRASGPPTVPVYATNCAFPLGDDAGLTPGWPRTADPSLTILIERENSIPAMTEMAKIGFIAPDMAAPFIHLGAEILVLEGSTPVATATVERLLDHD